MKIFLLTVVSFLLIILVLNAGYYKTWFVDKPMEYWADFQKQKDDTADIRGIMTGRFGLPYTICMRVKDVLAQKKVKDAVVLFEPNSYYRDSLHMQLRVPEPAAACVKSRGNSCWAQKERQHLLPSLKPKSAPDIQCSNRPPRQA